MKDYCKDNRKVPWDPEKGPSNKWFRGFLKRHSDELSEKVPRLLEAVRFKSCNVANIMHHFSDLQGTLNSGRFTDPWQFASYDEKRFTALGEIMGNAVCSQASQPMLIRSNNRELVTGGFAIFADGTHAPLVLVYKGKRGFHCQQGRYEGDDS